MVAKKKVAEEVTEEVTEQAPQVEVKVLSEAPEGWKNIADWAKFFAEGVEKPVITEAGIRNAVKAGRIELNSEAVKVRTGRNGQVEVWYVSPEAGAIEGWKTATTNRKEAEKETRKASLNQERKAHELEEAQEKVASLESELAEVKAQLAKVEKELAFSEAKLSLIESGEYVRKN